MPLAQRPRAQRPHASCPALSNELPEVIAPYLIALDEHLLNKILDYCAVPALVKVVYVTSKTLKEGVLTNLKCRSGIFSKMSLATSDLSLLQVRMLVILNDFITGASVPLKESVMMQKHYDDQDLVSDNGQVPGLGGPFPVNLTRNLL